MRPILEKGKTYRVVNRTWDNKGTVTARRLFLGREKRFGEIPCYVFSSRLTRRGYSSVISIPEYDLKECGEISRGGD
jgi:hypothetical protein